MEFWETIKTDAIPIAVELNLVTDHELDGDITAMSDGKLLARQSSIQRSIASSVIGFVLNLGLALLLTPFAVGAALNALQTAVSAVNRERVLREVNQRKASQAEFAKSVELSDHLALDIMVGCGIQIAVTGVCFALVRSFQILACFQAVAVPVNYAIGGLFGIAITPRITEELSKTMVSHIQAAAPRQIAPRDNEKAADSTTPSDELRRAPTHSPSINSPVHRRTKSIDDSQIHKRDRSISDGQVHKVIRAFSDRQMQQTTKTIDTSLANAFGKDRSALSPKIKWHGLGGSASPGQSKIILADKIMLAGLVTEIVQPAQQKQDAVIDKVQKQRQEQHAQRIIVENVHSQGNLTAGQVKTQISKEVEVRLELAEMLKRRKSLNGNVTSRYSR